MNNDEFFVDYIVKQLVEYPSDVRVERQTDDNGVLISLTVNVVDLGRVIGKNGTIAQSLRTLLRAIGMRSNQRYSLRIIDIRKNSHNYGEED